MRTRRSLIDLDDLTASEMIYIFERTADFEQEEPGSLLDGIACVNMFFENSTRTMTSFTLAEQRLGGNVITLWPKESSLQKGETIEDTAITLAAMGVNILVIRHPEDGYPRRVALAFDGHVINAGDGTHAHPTQGLLDIYTIRQEFGELRGRRVAIVGDILHSRVAHSNIAGLRAFGAEVILVGPPGFLPDDYMQPHAEVVRDLDSILPDVDAVMLLRIQRERIAAAVLATLDDYGRSYQLDARRLGSLASHAIVMHPGPYNRGVELTDDVLGYGGWRYAQQVSHGVYVRMAVLDFLVNGRA